MTPSLHEIESILNATDTSDFDSLSVAVLRNVTVDTFEPYLRYFALEAGLDMDVHFGEFDTIVQDVVADQSSLFAERLDAVMIFTYLETLSPDLTRRFSALSAEEIAAEEKRLQGFFRTVVQGIRERSDAMILWMGFESPIHPPLGIWDGQSDEGLEACVLRLNTLLREELQSVTNAYWVNTNACLARVGADKFYDNRFWHMGRAPFGREGMRALAFESSKFIRALKGKNKKCLVLDCDNTLWGGIIGEDGVAGVKLGTSHPGSGFYEFQQEIMMLANRGVIIALCSKNNEADVWEMFENHPDMVIKREDVVAWRINWQNKAANLRELAQEINIGLDSMVFVDDSEFEVELVRRELPEVHVIHLEKGRSTSYRSLLAESGLFDTLTLSAEDKARNAMYLAEAKRRQTKATAVDLTSYYRSLEMNIEMGMADSFSIPRIAQQTQKTNQFNLTTYRYSEADIERFAQSEDADVVWLKLKDRFGDSGIVGSCVMRYEGDTVLFDTLLLSCRVIGRDVERVFLSQLLAHAQSKGMTVAKGVYLKSAKNAQVETFYADQGFTEDNEVRTEDKREFLMDISGFSLPEIDYFVSVVFNK